MLIHGISAASCAHLDDFSTTENVPIIYSEREKGPRAAGFLLILKAL